MHPKPKILIITYNWPPRNTIGTLRPYFWAKYWSEAGCEVQVLTARKGIIDHPLNLNLPVLPGVSVVELAYGGLGDLRSVPKWMHLLRGPARAAAKLLSRMRGSGSADIRARWRSAVTAPLALLEGIDVIVSTFGPPSAHLIAHDLKRVRPSVRWIADYRDLWAENPLSEMSPKQRAQVGALEQATVGDNADAITTVSSGLASVLEKKFGSRVSIVPNGYDEKYLPQTSGIRAAKEKGSVCIVHTGTVYPATRNPKPVLIAINHIRQKKIDRAEEVRLHLYGSRLSNLAGALGIRASDRHLIVDHGHVGREKAIEAQRNADLLLLAETGADAGAITGKVFEYMVSGRPILGIGVTEDTELGKLLRSTGTGIAVGEDVEKISAAIEVLLAGETPFWFSPKSEEIERHSRERAADTMLRNVIMQNMDGR